jgi:hypothetical protein
MHIDCHFYNYSNEGLFCVWRADNAYAKPFLVRPGQTCSFDRTEIR